MAAMDQGLTSELLKTVPDRRASGITALMPRPEEPLHGRAPVQLNSHCPLRARTALSFLRLDSG